MSDIETFKLMRQQLEASGIVMSDEELLQKASIGLLFSFALFYAAGKPIRSVDELPVSSGYAPLLVGNGRNPIWARAYAALVGRHVRRRVSEAKRIRPTCEAIRFLAKPGRQKRSISRRAELLLNIDSETSIVGNIFYDAGLHEGEFLNVLRVIAEGREVDLVKVCAIAEQLLPYLPSDRGPKVTPASAAHEFILENNPALRSLHSPLPRCRGRIHVDALTRATQSEFQNPEFDSRPAVRRLRRRKARISLK